MGASKRLIRAGAAGVLLLLVGGAASARRSPLAGKAFFADAKALDVSVAALRKRFRGKKPRAKLARQAKKKKWVTTVVAFFRKQSFPGPITVWFYDTSDKQAIKAHQPTHLITIDAKPTRVLRRTIDVFENDGFNKGRSYLVKIGQIVGKRGRERIYARGVISLQP